MPLTLEQVQNPDHVLQFLNKLETDVQGIKPNPPGSPGPSLANQHPAKFCEVGEACPTCGHYVAEAKQAYTEARQDGIREGRNDLLVKLEQAAVDLKLEEFADILGVRMAQMEATAGDPAAKTLIIMGLNGKFAVIR